MLVLLTLIDKYCVQYIYKISKSLEKVGGGSVSVIYVLIFDWLYT